MSKRWPRGIAHKLVPDAPDDVGFSSLRNLGQEYAAQKGSRRTKELGERPWLDPRLVIMDEAMTFNVPLTNGAYANERFNLFSPDPEYAMHRYRWVREAAFPTGSKAELWFLKVGGLPQNDGTGGKPDDYLFILSNIMSALALATIAGPYRRTQLRVVSGGTSGVITVHGMGAVLEPIQDERKVTFNVPLTSGDYAPERLTLRSKDADIISHLSIYNESAKVSGSVIEHWSLPFGGVAENDGTEGRPDDWAFAEVFLTSATSRIANPIPSQRDFQMRVRSGGTSGQLVSHGLATARVGYFQPPHALSV